MTVLSGGSRLGPYAITGKLGEGGMGEVWRATDSRLKREVAIKVLPAAFTADPERLARFEREAQLLAQLHHPHIASIFGLEEADGARALVMELVEGEDLSTVIARGPLPTADALAIARQIAEALEAAHERGIVHRDLKPGNVKLRADGTVKVLDFGLAKAMDAAPGSGSGPATAAELARSPTIMNSPTLSVLSGTQLGVILGTAAYMAPEQARGGAVDRRADIWAFGVVLHEMLTGRPAFLADTVPDTLAAVLTRELDLAALPATVPPALRDLLRRCLQRKPKDRLHDIGDARILIDEILAGRTGEAPEPAAAMAAAIPARAAWRTRLLWLAAGLGLGLLAMASVDRTFRRPLSPPPPSVRSLTYSGSSRAASMSPDGRVVAFSSARTGTPRIWLKQMTTGEEAALTAGPDVAPLVSPDGSTVLFGRLAGGAIDLYRVPLVGGEPRRLASRVIAAAWSPDGTHIAIARPIGGRAQIGVMPADGGEERKILEEDEAVRGGLDWSPDGTRLLALNVARVNAIARMTLVTVDVASGARREIYAEPAGSLLGAARWDGNDAVVFTSSSSQAGRAAAFLRRLVLGASVAQPVFSIPAMPGRFELVGRGAVLYDQVGVHQNLFEMGTGTALGRSLSGGPTIDRQPALSPDGKRVVFSSDRSGSLDLWSLELASGTMRRLTFDAADDWDPHWSADGAHLLWSSNRGGHFEVWMADADGTGARQVTHDGVDAENPTMSGDGKWVVYGSGNPAHRGVWKVHPDGTGAAPLVRGVSGLPEVSPVSGWVSTVGPLDQGRQGIHIVRLDDGAQLATLVIHGSRLNPGRSRWMPDGHTLVFFADDEAGAAVLFAQTVVPGRDTDAERRVVARSDERRGIESFGVSPVDGQLVVSAGWTDSDVFLAEGIPGIGASLRATTAPTAAQEVPK